MKRKTLITAAAVPVLVAGAAFGALQLGLHDRPPVRPAASVSPEKATPGAFVHGVNPSSVPSPTAGPAPAAGGGGGGNGGAAAPPSAQVTGVNPSNSPPPPSPTPSFSPEPTPPPTDGP